MAAPRMTQEDVGAFYAGPDGTVWKLVGYASSPTATLERVYPVPVTEAILGQRVRRDGVVGDPIFDGFTRLVLDGGLSEQVARCVYPGCPSSNDDLRPVGHVRVVASDSVPEILFSCPTHVDWLKDNGVYVAFDLGATG